jgi:hypothetical protein
LNDFKGRAVINDITMVSLIDLLWLTVNSQRILSLQTFYLAAIEALGPWERHNSIDLELEVQMERRWTGPDDVCDWSMN